ncbi:hypothetical protein EYF80_033041 [Liparis tanakae]|uniref:Uncharacterized protein n=1 Tax=Liparis tanakae TaxID=230148 RepID=A0A4Z2GVK5_9TELE|nr:hypothetical protein EYF80_033041 [Liparis tanakae]
MSRCTSRSCDTIAAPVVALVVRRALLCRDASRPADPEGPTAKRARPEESKEETGVRALHPKQSPSDSLPQTRHANPPDSGYPTRKFRPHREKERKREREREHRRAQAQK